MKEKILRLCEVTRAFGSTHAVNRLTLEVGEGEIFALLGPSGCGKSTTLRMITGLEHPDAGDIYIRDRLVASGDNRVFVPAHKRNMGMVCQSYAIWPHLTVFENVAYPLRALGTAETELRERVHGVLALVGLEGLDSRPGPLLSGGQQQRVALARALVYEPQILLLDEPFSSLDAKLREQMQSELKQLQRRTGITTIFVTHDQVEALSLSDRIALMHRGQLMQVGTPQELYEKPANPFVRDFLGKSVVLEGTVEDPGTGQAEVLLAGDPPRTLLAGQASLSEVSRGQAVAVAIRPEDIEVLPQNSQEGCNRLDGIITTLRFIGDRYECHVRIGDVSFVLHSPRPTHYQEGQTIRLHFPAGALTVWSRQNQH